MLMSGRISASHKSVTSHSLRTITIKLNFSQKTFGISQNIHTFAVPNSKREAKLRYGVMVALQILALSVRVRVLLSQQHFDKSHGGIAQLVRAHDS